MFYVHVLVNVWIFFFNLPINTSYAASMLAWEWVAATIFFQPPSGAKKQVVSRASFDDSTTMGTMVIPTPLARLLGVSTER